MGKRTTQVWPRLTEVGDMDGDGWVFRASVAEFPLGGPEAQFSLDYGKTTVNWQVREDEIGEVIALFKAARKALRAKLEEV